MTGTRIRNLVLAVTTLSAACALSACDTHDGTSGAKGAPAAPPAGTVSASKDTGPTQDDSDSSTLTVALDKTATWKNGVTARLNGFSRGTTSEFASPSHKAYLAFSITVKNGSASPLDLSLFNLSCPGGADEVFDEHAGFGGAPDAHVLPGKSQTWKEACVFAKTAKSVQIELTPMDTSDDGWYRTAIFTGTVR
ncbi:hypothetical protein [Actinacidiphila bryophytorum]|uniref:hypothetical protein n=1 Tax=Actinacidiphila bryophytorum TaxID=1436133 RepID=UPI002176B006|nr:hypothetical protein [Actinacidiphila bryophytorum]UWE07567.1 hypothetical protein NYE86_01655 [Actinacidiphila bryophytorum]